MGGGEAQVIVRAGRYRSRPGHLDPLHLDVRFGPREVVVDPGTFSYNAPAPWNNGLVAAHVHNGMVLDGREPGLRGRRFLWYVWPDARLMEVAAVADAALITAQRPGEARRRVRVSPREVVVEDECLAASGGEAAIRWLLHPTADPRAIRCDGDMRVRAADETGLAGWFSPHYGQRLPSRSVEIRRQLHRGDIVTTRILHPDDVPPGETPPSTPAPGPHCAARSGAPPGGASAPP